MVARACNPSYSGGWGRRIAFSQEAEGAVSQNDSTALQPGQQKQNSAWKRKKEILDFKNPLYNYNSTFQFYLPYPCWSAVMRSWLPATFAFQVQVVLLPQPPE